MEVFFYIAAGLTSFWGISHLLPTKNIVRDFGEISADNKQIITMEWIIEGISLIFIGVLLAGVTYIDSESPVSIAVYWLTIGMLNLLSIISFFTGFKVKFLPFKLCPAIFTGSSILVLIGILS